MSYRSTVKENSARTQRLDSSGKAITVDVRAGSNRATITNASGKKRTARFIPRKGARYGFVVEKGHGLRVDQPRSVSCLPKSYVARKTRSNPTPKR